jgi:SHS2 domain-containing protein
MTKSCTTFDHTADVGLEGRGDTLGELFEALAEGLARYICPSPAITSREVRRITVQAEDSEVLAVDFLWEVMCLVQHGRFVVSTASVLEIDGHRLTADLSGEPYDPERHDLACEVKAVTYHGLRVAEENGRWVGRVILDL